MNILHVISTIDAKAGGPPRALVGLAKAQAEVGLCVTVAASYRAGSDLALADEMRQAGVEVHLIGPCRGPLSRHRDLKPTLPRLIAAADIIHIHALWEEIQYQAARSAQRLNKPYLITPHGMLDPWSLAQSRWKKRLYMAWRLRRNLNQAAALHFTTASERDLTRPLGLKTSAIVEPLGIDLREFDELPCRGRFRNRRGIADDISLVAFMGRIHPGKGLEYLIPALANVATADYKLAVIGPDSHGYRRIVETLIDHYDMQDRVLFTGMLQGRELIEALVDADLFSLPSEHENFGMSVVESLAAGTPVLISDQVAIHQEITAAGVGEAVPLDVDLLTAALNRWLSDTALRQSASAKTQSFARTRYDWTNIATRWVGHYKALTE